MSKLSEIGIDGVYVIHALKGYELQQQHVERLFGANGIDFEFMTDGDPSLFTKELLDKYIVPTIPISTGAKSCTLNHILSFQRVVEQRNRYALIFENDPCFLGDFTKKIQRVMAEVQAKKLSGFIISLENSGLRYPTVKETKRGEYLYPKSTGRLAGAYLIDLQAATNIIEDLKTTKCNMVIDWWHNSLIERGIVKMYWAHPPLTEQGSHNGKFCSSISTKDKSLSQRIKWTVHKFYKRHFLRTIRGIF